MLQLSVKRNLCPGRSYRPRRPKRGPTTTKWRRGWEDDLFVNQLAELPSSWFSHVRCQYRMRMTSHRSNSCDAGSGYTNETRAARAEDWVKQPDGPPVLADVAAQEKGRAELTDDPGQEDGSTCCSASLCSGTGSSRKPDCNGDWHPHLHLQGYATIKRKIWRKPLGNLQLEKRKPDLNSG